MGQWGSVPTEEEVSAARGRAAEADERAEAAYQVAAF